VNKDIVIVDHVTKLSYKEVTSEWMEDFNKKIYNVRKYRGKIERRKEKILSLIHI
jgi:hypothetical protein